MRKLLTLLLALALTVSALGVSAPRADAVVTLYEKSETGEPEAEQVESKRVEAALAWAVATAEDDSHGYSQACRFGPSYDCASFVTAALIAGGFKLDEPAGDLPVALALYSSLTEKALPDTLIAIGEVGLAGEIRNVSHIVQRVQEARRMGFEVCIVPKQALAALPKSSRSLRIFGVSSLRQAFNVLAKLESEKEASQA